MASKVVLPRIETGVHNLDLILNGGLPKGSVTVMSGPPGSGKTTLEPKLVIVKTRGSDHVRGSHAVTIAAGGLRVRPAAGAVAAPRTSPEAR